MPESGTAFDLPLALAWEAFQLGSFPVGAVIVDGGGDVIAKGRNRIGEDQAPEGRLRNSALAHAEVDVLGQLRLGDYDDYTLYTTLEPCLLCQAAATMSHIGRIVYLAHDAVCDGLEAIGQMNDHARRRYPTIEGPTEALANSDKALFAAVLPMAVLLAFNPSGDSARTYAAATPPVFEVASFMVRQNAWPSRKLVLDEAVASVAAVAHDVRGRRSDR